MFPPRFGRLGSDNTRGEPHPWTAEEIKKLDLTLKDGVISGNVHLSNETGSRSAEVTRLPSCANRSDEERIAGPCGPKGRS